MSETIKLPSVEERIIAGLREGIEWAKGEREMRTTMVKDNGPGNRPTRTFTVGTGRDSGSETVVAREYAVVYKSGKSQWSAYVPDLPGCVATGKTREETELNIK